MTSWGDLGPAAADLGTALALAALALARERAIVAGRAAVEAGRRPPVVYIRELSRRMKERHGRADMVEPTDRQRQFLRVIAKHLTVHGFAPTLRELCGVMGCASTNGVHQQLVALERKGCLERRPGSARAMRITTRGWVAVGRG